MFWPLTRRTCSRELQSDVNFCLHVVIPHQSAGWRCASCRAPSSSSITPATVNGRIILLLVVDWEAPPPQLPPPTASAPMTACICETHRDYKVVWMTIRATFSEYFSGVFQEEEGWKLCFLPFHTSYWPGRTTVQV